MPKLTIFLERENQTQELEVKSIKEIFEKLIINPEEVIIALNGKLVTKHAEITDGDEISLLSVISGG